MPRGVALPPHPPLIARHVLRFWQLWISIRVKGLKQAQRGRMSRDLSVAWGSCWCESLKRMQVGVSTALRWVIVTNVRLRSREWIGRGCKFNDCGKCPIRACVCAGGDSVHWFSTRCDPIRRLSRPKVFKCSNMSSPVLCWRSRPWQV